MNWEAIKRRHCVTVARVVHASDTFTVRLLIAWASGLYAVALMLATVAGLELFTRPVYALMATVGNEWSWSAAFLLHWAGVHWRILDPKERIWAGLVVNFFGFVLWLYSTLCMNLALGYFPPSSALEWTIIGFAGWALYRTGLRSEMVTA